MRFDSILVANRGEIAIRVMRAARELGLRCIAVYSEADRDSPHVHYADEALLIGPAAPTESYLVIERVIEAALRAGAGAIHPGYGFLSEKSEFARAVHQAGLVFVGPPPEAMERMGGKVNARREAQAAGVPMVPGTVDPVGSADEVLRLGAQFGYPIAVKAVGGGGGRGLRVVNGVTEVRSAYESATREAGLAFKDSRVYVERYLPDPRHIEIQVLADMHGNVVHLGERDCSIQRRHQKLIEESPSPALTPELRAEMGAAAVRLARSVEYVSAGTLEFLFQDGQYFFLEMNTRIQVEHTVTEMLTGIDLVQAQIRIAQGEPLWFTQEQIQPRGHAIQCRINAEDPANNFRPTTGTLGNYREPHGFGIRVDSAAYPGYTIPPHYDSLVSKLVVWAENRPLAISRMARALADYTIEGIHTTIPFHRLAMAHPAFREGQTTVNFISRYLADQLPSLAREVVSGAPAPEAPARTFEVEVSGRRYTVRVAEPGAESAPDNGAERKRRPGPRKPAAKGGAKLAAPANAVTSPIQGVVLGVRVKPGDEVQAGQVLFVIEAMKMENEIPAPRAGTIGSVQVKHGATIESGAILASYK